MNTNKRTRQKGALERLENQLKIGKKTEKKGFNQIDLTDSDKKRINKEIETLKSKMSKTGI